MADNIKNNCLINDDALNTVSGGSGSITFETKYELSSNLLVNNTFDTRPGAPATYTGKLVGFNLRPVNDGFALFYVVSIYLNGESSPSIHEVAEDGIIGLA